MTFYVESESAYICVVDLATSFDLRDIEGIVERALMRSRGEELKLVAEAVKTLANYMRNRL